MDNRKSNLLPYLAATAFCALFYLVYDHFSHGVHSPWMTWLFAWPLALGVLPSALEEAGIWEKATRGKTGGGQKGVESDVRGGRPGESRAGRLGEAGRDIYRFGLAAVTVASLLKGILEIAGTDSPYPSYLLYAGFVQLACGIIFRLCHFFHDAQ